MTSTTWHPTDQRYTSRVSFAAIVRRALREGVLVRYERDLRLGRTAVLSNGSVHTYEPAWRTMLAEGRF